MDTLTPFYGYGQLNTEDSNWCVSVLDLPGPKSPIRLNYHRVCAYAYYMGMNDLAATVSDEHFHDRFV